MRQRKEPGRGSTIASAIGSNKHYAGWRRIVIAFDKETFKTIRGRALANRISFAEQVRLLVKAALTEEEGRP